MLLNLSIFMWFGAVCPWASFVHNDVIPIFRLIPLGLLILLFRRVPVVYAMHWKIRQIEEKRQALFVGFFGPIGVSAIFYLYISLEFLKNVTMDGVIRKDTDRLTEIMTVVIWFLAMCSIVRLSPFYFSTEPHTYLHVQVVHGLSVPVGKLGYRFSLSRTVSSAIDAESRTDLELPARKGQMHLRNLSSTVGRIPPGLEITVGGSIRSKSPEMNAVASDGNQC